MSNGSLGNLVVSLEANIAKFTSDMGRAASVAETAMGKVAAAGRLVGASLGPLGGGAIAAGLASIVTRSIAADSALNNLAKTTALTVGQLSTMSDVARASGTSMDLVTGAVLKLQRGIDDAREGSKDVTQAFRMLGIDASDGALKASTAVDMIATRMLQMEDGVLKNNIAMKLLGKTGTELNEFLTDYATRGQTAARVSTEMAENAEKLDRAWRGLGHSMSDTLDKMGQWITRGIGKLYDIDVQDRLDQVIKRQRNLRDEIEKLERFGGSENNAFARLYAPEKLEKARAALAALNEEQIKLSKTLGILSFGPANSDQNDRKLYQGVVLDPGKPPKVDEFKRVVEALNQALAEAKLNLGELFDSKALTQAERALASIMASDRWKSFTAQQQERIKNGYAEIGTIQRQIAEFTNLAAASAGVAAQRKKDEDLWKAAVERSEQSTKELIERLKQEAEMIGLTNEERERSIALKQLDADRTAGLIKSEEEYLQRLSDLKAAFDIRDAAAREQRLRESLNRQVQQHESAYDRIGQTVLDALMRGFEGGKDAGKNFVDTLTNSFKSLAMRPAIQGMLGAAFPGAASASSTGLGSFFGNDLGLGNPFGTGLSMKQWGGGIYSPEGGPPAFMLGDRLGQGLAGAGIGLGIGSLFGGFVDQRRQQGTQIGGTIGGAIGAMTPLGPIGAMIGSVIGSAIGSLFKSGGGPKSGGFASSVDNVSRFFTPNDRDASMGTLVSAQAEAFRQALKGLGGSGIGGFAFGFDVDPKGTANSRVSSGAFINGRSVYSNINVEAGRDEASLQAALDIEAKRALLAALQASSLPDDVARILSSIGAAGASASDIDRVISLGGAMKTVGEAIRGLSDIDGTLAEMNQGSVGAIESQGEALRDLLAQFDGSASATAELSAATADYYESLVRTVGQIRNLRADIDAMFSSTRESIYLSNRSDPFKNDYFAERAEQLFASLSTLTDPEAIGRATSQFNDIIGQAFNLRDPLEQIKDREHFLDSANRFQAFADARLQELEAQVRESGGASFDDVKQAIEDAAETNRQASATQLEAARLQVEAAKTPIRIWLPNNEYHEVNG